MALLNIFRNPKPRQFDYKPRFYDAEKEEREERIRRIQMEKSVDHSAEAMKVRIQQGLKAQRMPVDRNYRRRYERRSNRLVVSIVVVLVVFVMYFIFRYGNLLAEI